MMDRPSSSTTPPLIENDNDMTSFVTKIHLFGAQKALHQEQQAMRDYFDNKFYAHKQENDARMDEILAVATRPQMVKSLCSGVIPGSVMLTPHSTSKDL